MAINDQDGALRTLTEKGGSPNVQDGALRTIAEKESSGTVESGAGASTGTSTAAAIGQSTAEAIFFGSPTTHEQTTAASETSIYGGSVERVAQSFKLPDGGRITSVALELRKLGTPPGNLTLGIFNDTGTYGTSSEPGTTSQSPTATVVADSVSTSPGDIAFTFSEPSDFLDSATAFSISVTYEDGDNSNKIYVARNSSDVSDGNYADFTGSTWTPNSSWDTYYKISYLRDTGFATAHAVGASVSASFARSIGLIDEILYPFSGDGGFFSLYTGSNKGTAESFDLPYTPFGVLSVARFGLRKLGTPTGNAFAVLYAHTGSFGTTSEPTGAALATSEPFDVSTLGTSFGWHDLIFTDGFSLASTPYCIAIEYDGGDVSNRVEVDHNSGSAVHDGNASILNSSDVWNDNSGSIIFKLFAARSYVAATGVAVVGGVAASTGTSTTTAVSQTIAAGVGSSSATSTALAVGENAGGSTASSTGTSTAAAVSQSIVGSYARSIFGLIDEFTIPEVSLNFSAFEGHAQSFDLPFGLLDKAAFKIRKVFSPTGNVTAVLYAHSGTFGSTSAPTGAALDTSDPIDVSTLSGTLTWTDFIFHGGYDLVASEYCIALEYADASGPNYIEAAAHSGPQPEADGNSSNTTGASWSPSATELLFKVYQVVPTTAVGVGIAEGDASSAGTSTTTAVGVGIAEAVASVDGTVVEESAVLENNLLFLSSVGNHEGGQSFAAGTRRISEVTFWLEKFGSPTGNAFVHIYAHTGTFGSTGTPIGYPLATSAAFDVSTLSTSPTQETAFAIDFIPTPATNYFVVFNYEGGDGSNNVRLGVQSGDFYDGNIAYRAEGAWTADYLDGDAHFEIKSSDQPIGIAYGVGQTIAEAVASADGTSTATAVGQSESEADASSVGTSTALAVGQSEVEADASSAGTSTVTAVGQSFSIEPLSRLGLTGFSRRVRLAFVYPTGATAGAADAVGTSTASAVGQSEAEADASSVGTSTTAAVGQSTAEADASSTGASTTAAVGVGIVEGVASSAGISTTTAVGVGIVEGDASSVGTSTTTAVGVGVAEADASSAGTSTTAAVGVGTTEADASSTGTSTVTAVGQSEAEADASAAGTSTAPGVGQSEAEAVGNAAGTSTTAATGTDGAGDSGVATAGGTSTAAAVGQSEAEADASSTGTSTVTAVGQLTAEADGSAAGTSTATADSESISAGAGSSDGTSTSSAIGRAIAISTFAALGLAACTGIGQSIVEADASSTGTSVVTAVGQQIAVADADAAGTSTASATGELLISGVFSSDGVGTATAVGKLTFAGVFSSDGVGTASGAGTDAGSAVLAGDGNSAGSSTVAGVGGQTTGVPASAAGSSTAAGIGQSEAEADGSSTGLATVTGAGAAVIPADGASAGTSTAPGVGSGLDIASGDGDSAGVATATGVGVEVLPTVGSSVGVATATADSESLAAGVGSSAGAATAAGVGQSEAEAVGNAVGTGVALGIAPEIFIPINEELFVLSVSAADEFFQSVSAEDVFPESVSAEDVFVSTDGADITVELLAS